MPLGGKEVDEGVFFNLLNLEIDFGYEGLKTHLEKCLLADRTADIAGKEELSISLCFYNESHGKSEKNLQHKIPHHSQKQLTIFWLTKIFHQNSMLDLVLMAVLQRQANMVVNNANNVPEIRNSIAMVKDTINFFRELTACRN
ncbi:hypothetical protein PR048_019044 [Dryococelus australis]|uniref:Interleukin-6 n=1 Tax=Dryococelus australis TaxID=614101 RepID=A0ABQ9H2R3_9NEOP|nr:hypothetical protein PR048_019044 [Dryococelus australis]